MEFLAPRGETLAVGTGFKTGEHGCGEEPARFLEIGAVVESGAEEFEAVEGFILHDFVQDLPCMEGGDGMVATGEITEVIEVTRSVMPELFFDESHGLLVIVGEQSHECGFLGVHALDGN
jgi:hypothetical protein